jgi:hypothetical protein
VWATTGQVYLDPFLFLFFTFLYILCCSSLAAAANKAATPIEKEDKTFTFTLTGGQKKTSKRQEQQL